MKYIVTGGGGFLGRALCLRLAAQGHEVWSVSRGRYPQLEEHGIRGVSLDLGKNVSALAEVFPGTDAVFHTAAKIDMWGPYPEFFQTNVKGTENIISLCLAHKVRKLVFTSSPSVIADGRNLRGVNEDYPYPKRHGAFYPATKAAAERAVLAANSNELWTVALRPHLIWGPGDTNLVPTIIERAKAGRLVRVGNGKNLTDVVYIDDCVAAHLCALDALENNAACRGKAYFISQGEPVMMWDWIDDILLRNGLPPVRRTLPVWAADVVALCCEGYAACRGYKKEPLLTRFLVSQMSKDHYFDIGRAKEMLGFCPQYTVAEAMNAAFGVKPASTYTA